MMLVPDPIFLSGRQVVITANGVASVPYTFYRGDNKRIKIYDFEAASLPISELQRSKIIDRMLRRVNGSKHYAQMVQNASKSTTISIYDDKQDTDSQKVA